MTVMNALIETIINESATLYERINGQFEPSLNIQESINNTRINSYLEKWCQISSNGNRNGFANRLAHDGFEIETIRPFLGSVKQIPTKSSPPWLKNIEKGITAAK